MALVCLKDNANRHPDDLRASTRSILKVSATWCSPCQEIHHPFALLARDHENIDVFILDLEAAQQEGGDAQQLLNVLDIEALPTFVAFAEGKEVGRVKGSNLETIRQIFTHLSKWEQKDPEAEEGGEVL